VPVNEINDLIGIGEIARILGVSRARASQLRQSDSTFPRPWFEFAWGSVYLRQDVIKYASSRNRKPGRPRGK